MESSSFVRCALKVDTQSAGWQKSMDNMLSSIEGVSYNIDSQEGIAYVSGNIDAGRLMRRLSKAKHAELCWVDSRRQNKNNPVMQGDGYYDEYGQYRRIGYDHVNGYSLNHQYGALGYGYGYGNNQYGRLAYVDENCQRSEMAAQSSPHASLLVVDRQTLPPPPPLAAAAALKKSEEKRIHCCMM